jgi:hypothetical protein
MKSIINFLIFLNLTFIFSSCKSDDSSDSKGNETTTSVVAFNGAEGGGAYTSGGRGGPVYIVKSLEDDLYGEIPGTLRYAIKQSGPRTIVFNVSGTIALKSKLIITNGSLTIAGQTAPGKGITIRDYPVYITASNVIIRFVRFRMGDVTAQQDDALGAQGSKNILIDHCSMSWSTDECGSFYNNTNFTLQWCILSESLNNSVHEKGAHGYGGIWGGNNASFHHNLLAHHNSRNPRFDHDCISSLRGPIDFENNVIYNWGSNSSYGGENRQINIVNNYYKSGSASTYKNRIFNPAPSSTTSPFCGGEINSNGRYYITGNYVNGYTDATADNWTYGVQGITSADKSIFKVSSPFSVTTINAQTAEAAYSSVLAYAGASLSRDTVDVRIISNVTNGDYTAKVLEVTTAEGSHSANGLIDSQAEVGGWPETAGVIQQQRASDWDTDYDGIPDYWEDLHGLNKNSSVDGLTKTLDPAGQLTNLEVYLNDIVSGLYSH